MKVGSAVGILVDRLWDYQDSIAIDEIFSESVVGMVRSELRVRQQAQDLEHQKHEATKQQERKKRNAEVQADRVEQQEKKTGTGVASTRGPSARSCEVASIGGCGG